MCSSSATGRGEVEVFRISVMASANEHLPFMDSTTAIHNGNLHCYESICKQESKEIEIGGFLFVVKDSAFALFFGFLVW